MRGTKRVHQISQSLHSSRNISLFLFQGSLEVVENAGVTQGRRSKTKQAQSRSNHRLRQSLHPVCRYQLSK
ncbi:conjugal transfer domain protein (plasmid) [Yersinia pestis]|nr:conjugal transfer domain protein [Yersinia pestis]